MRYNGFEIDDNKIDEYVEKLGCSIAEACDLILEESGKQEETEETKNAIKTAEKNAPRRYEKSGNRKKAEKVRKVDEIKGFLLGRVKTVLEELDVEITNVKTETEIDFNYKGASYTFKLTRHTKNKSPKN